MTTTPQDLWTALLGAMLQDGMIAQCVTTTGPQTTAIVTDLAARLSAPALTEDEQRVVNWLCEVVHCADNAMDNSEHDEHEGIVVQNDDFEAMEHAVQRLTELPDDQPGYVMGPAAKAAWALRRVNPERVHIGEAKPDYVTVIQRPADGTNWVPVQMRYHGSIGYIVEFDRDSHVELVDALKDGARWAVELGVEFRP